MQMTHSKSLKVSGRPWHSKIAIFALLGLALLANWSQAQSTDSTASKTLSLGTVLLNQKLMVAEFKSCLLYTSPSPRDRTRSRMPSSA